MKEDNLIVFGSGFRIFGRWNGELFNCLQGDLDVLGSFNQEPDTPIIVEGPPDEASNHE